MEEKPVGGAKAKTTRGCGERGTRRRVSIAPTRSGGTWDRVQSGDGLKRHPSSGSDSDAGMQ